MVVLSESVEKHDRNVYELGAEALSNEERAAVFTRVLGKPITYEQQSFDDFYKALTGAGMSHSIIYNFAMGASKDICDTTTPQISILIGRPLHTLEEWLKDSAKAFQ